jgi:hypothetical protein
MHGKILTFDYVVHELLMNRVDSLVSHVTLLRRREYFIQFVRLIKVEISNPSDIMRNDTHANRGNCILAGN